MARRQSYPLYSAVYLNGLRLLFVGYVMYTKADDMCQTELFESDKGVTFQISQTVTPKTTNEGCKQYLDIPNWKKITR